MSERVILEGQKVRAVIVQSCLAHDQMLESVDSLADILDIVVDQMPGLFETDGGALVRTVLREYRRLRAKIPSLTEEFIRN